LMDEVNRDPEFVRRRLEQHKPFAEVRRALGKQSNLGTCQTTMQLFSRSEKNVIVWPFQPRVHPTVGSTDEGEGVSL
jgi:hypothetical protein